MAEKSEKPKQVPKDAEVIMCIMKEMGILDYEPKVINRLLEFTYGYVACVLEDAKIYAHHAKKKVIDLEDVRLSVQLKLEKSFTNPPPREVLMDVARSKNFTPLPLIKPHCGLRLPPDRYCLSSCNYKLKPYAPKKTAIKTNVSSVNPKMNQKSTNQQNLLVKRPGTLVTVSKTQSVNVPKPVFKFSSGNKVMAKPSMKGNTSNQHPTSQGNLKMETDDSKLIKRKRDDDDYDIF